ncbi:DUF6165 family protein [Albimonas pacifica]|uniref:Uncharacterized protein n=1 Tax=Albimonas pacifica TaxID=1114924 RepID=A0A1I3MP49_9RHOB|nr:DUF6165 family protein [Albimonas pacifica]SFI98580.1 hypothetical protein SAMN05216258_111183 [Albimonas pacifica]
MTAPSPRSGETGVMVEISPGELIDKITILEIKSQRLSDPSRRFNVTTELELLVAARDAALPAPAELDDLTDALREVNGDLWSIEDDLRACESRGDFGPGFVALARSVYRLNDRRAALKREINLLLRSRLMEEKSHPLY